MSLGPHEKRKDPREIAEQAIAERNELAAELLAATADWEDWRVRLVKLLDLAELIAKREGL